MARNIKSLKGPVKFKPWLNQIVTRLFYDHIRSKNRKLKTVPIDKKDDDEQDGYSVTDLAFPASTNVDTILRQFNLAEKFHKDDLLVVFSTHQSIAVIAKAQKEF